LTLTEGVIAILSGLTFGRIADVYGFPTLFTTLAILELVLPVFAVLLKDKSFRSERYHDLQRIPERAPRLRIGKAFAFLLTAQLFAGISIHVGSLGRSLTMTELGFSAAAISSTVAVGGLVSMPLRPILGELSDRFRREYILAILNTFTVIGLVILSVAESLIQFWIAFAFLYISFIRGPVGAALVTDLVPRESLGRGMAIYNVANRVGGIIGFSSTGYAIQQLGASTAFIAAAVLPAIGFVLMLSISRIQVSKSQMKRLV
jgi:MFS-type transporter involved in bile tolerance (Atg22 family)